VTARTAVALELERRGGGTVARLTLDNPGKLNVLSGETLEALAKNVQLLENQPDLRAVVLTGAGRKAFCGGVDIAALRGLDAASARQFIGLIHAACAALRACPVPVVARINGWCIGGALEIAAACDLRIAADTARFSMPEVHLGIPSVVEAALLPRLVGAGRARWLVMTGEAIDAETALVWGLIERISRPENLDKETGKTLDQILAGGAEAMRAQKRLCKLWEEAPLAESVRVSIDEFARSYESAEPRRRIDAFRKNKGS
jgi:enoyl-CoA hydratase/carnithine racemase